jgi:GYF domain 2
MQNDAPFLGRILTFTFVLLCLGASIFGAAVLFLAAAFGLSFVEFMIGVEPQLIYQGPALIFFIIIGGILPTMLLIRRRRKYRCPQPTPPNILSHRDRTDNLRKPEQTEGTSQSDFISNNNRAAEPRIEKIWYYADGGKRTGPVAASDIEELLARRQIDKNVEVWRKGMKDWVPIHETELVNKIDDVTPPLPSHAVNNIIVWLLAFSPLIFAAIDQTMKQQQVLQMLGGNVSSLNSLLSGNVAGIPWFVPGAIYFVLCVIDINLLYRAGYRAWYLGASAFLFSPIYPFVRASRLKQPPYYGFVFIVCLLLQGFA